MAVSIQTDPPVGVSAPRVLFEVRFPPGDAPKYDIVPDGDRFIAIEEGEWIPGTEIRVVLNWFDELKRRVPSAR